MNTIVGLGSPVFWFTFGGPIQGIVTPANLLLGVGILLTVPESSSDDLVVQTFQARKNCIDT
jgi:hypothetical protein